MHALLPALLLGILLGKLQPLAPNHLHPGARGGALAGGRGRGGLTGHWALAFVLRPGPAPSSSRHSNAHLLRIAVTRWGLGTRGGGWGAWLAFRWDEGPVRFTWLILRGVAWRSRSGTCGKVTPTKTGSSDNNAWGPLSPL